MSEKPDALNGSEWCVDSGRVKDCVSRGSAAAPKVDAACSRLLAIPPLKKRFFVNSRSNSALSTIVPVIPRGRVDLRVDREYFRDHLKNIRFTAS